MLGPVAGASTVSEPAAATEDPMQRVPEPELMDDPAQAEAYAGADFSEPNRLFVVLFRECFPQFDGAGHVLDLGCGPADIAVRFARAFPSCCVDGVDGAESMLRPGRQRVAQAALGGRVRLVHGVIPGVELPRSHYDAVISNSLLHHLHAPAVLWDAVKRWGRPGAAVLIMDLARPQGEAEVDELVATYAADAPPLLQRDFRASLCAAFRPEEVRAQLVEAGLSGLRVGMVSDRHLAVSGRLPGAPDGP
jgi:SAM-dependent methyltransferase